MLCHNFRTVKDISNQLILLVRAITTTPPSMSRRDQVLVIEPPNELTFTGGNIEKILVVDYN